MYETLNELKKKQKYISVYTKPGDPDKFSFGRIICLSDQLLVLRSITPDGSDDGLSVKEICDVFRVDEDSQYCKKMEKLMEASGCQEPDFDDEEIDEENIVSSVLELSKRKNWVITVWPYDGDGIIGTVESLNGDVCVINQFDDYGKDDGKTTVFTESITEIWCNSSDERIISKLRTSE